MIRNRYISLADAPQAAYLTSGGGFRTYRNTAYNRLTKEENRAHCVRSDFRVVMYAVAHLYFHSQMCCCA